MLLLAACAAAVEHAELVVFKDRSSGARYGSSLDYFASPYAAETREQGFVPLAETVIELYGGIDETATVVGPFANHYAGGANHEDGLARGIRIAARDWSTGPNSIATDLEDAFDAAEDQSRASEYSITTQTTVALCEDLEIIDRYVVELHGSCDFLLKHAHASRDPFGKRAAIPLAIYVPKTFVSPS